MTLWGWRRPDRNARFLYRVEVRRVGRQVDELAAPRLDQPPYPLGPVCPEIVHHHNLTGAQGGGQQALHVSLEHSGRGSSFHGHRGSHPFLMEASKQRGVLAAVSRDLEEGSLAYGRVGVKWSQGSVGAHLIDEHQSPRIDAANLHAPQPS